MLTVQDDTDAIYVWVGAADIPPLRAGQLVELEGFSGPGDFAPVVASPRIWVVGEQAMPEPLRMDVDQLLSAPPEPLGGGWRHRLLDGDRQRPRGAWNPFGRPPFGSGSGEPGGPSARAAIFPCSLPRRSGSDVQPQAAIGGGACPGAKAGVPPSGRERAIKPAGA